MAVSVSKAAIPLYLRRGFKKCVGADCMKYIDIYMDGHGGRFDTEDFSSSFDVYNAAHKLYKRVHDIERFNTEGAKKALFLKEIAYVFDRHMPYYIYRKAEEMNGRIAKPVKNWFPKVFPKDEMEASSVYEYRINEDELADEIRKLIGYDAELCDAAVMDTEAVEADGTFDDDEDGSISYSGAGEYIPVCVDIVAECIPYDKSSITSFGGDNTRSSGNYVALLKQFSSEKILHYMDKYGYPDEDYAIMAGDEEYLQKTNPVLFNPKVMQKKRMDGRTAMQFYQDMVSGWLYENMFAECINRTCGNINVRLAGIDSNRQIIVKDDKVTNRADYMVEYRGKEIPMELSVSHTGYAYSEEKISLRNNKRMHLVEQNAILLSVETFALEGGDAKSPIFAMVYGDEYKLSFTEKNPKYHDKECDNLTIRFDKYHPLREFCGMLETRLERICAV